MSITLQAQGSFKRTGNFLQRILKQDIKSVLNTYGAKGVSELARCTPRKTGRTAMSWNYEVSKTGTGWAVSWNNTNINKGVPIAIVIEYGHGTGWGGYVPPHPYIMKALQPIYDEIASTVWQEVTNG